MSILLLKMRDEGIKYRPDENVLGWLDGVAEKRQKDRGDVHIAGSGGELSAESLRGWRISEHSAWIDRGRQVVE